ncbi:prepilin peptidase [Wenjunlia tyrosinilytica]|uniref:Prepilin peptidase n=1 Tax=Wenjunlia tyrosinilytica TaxID=1544741 RepID=A0A918E063_9ACTN|nr:A24 family peptidase [Wenjunlia tyrosinilytica]GGO97576.1 prepilin peptidase [Wenjunlia tyrosinilytica]
MNLPLVVSAAGFGALAGALLPGAVHRMAVEPEQPWRDVCPNGHALRGLLPKCGRCSAWYGPDARLAAAVTALVCGLLALASGARPETVVWLLLAPFAVLLAAVDLRVRRLPDVLTLPMAAGTAALLGVAALMPHGGGSWVRALLGAGALASFYFAMFLISPRGMGFGDVKLALTLGLVLGWYGWDTVLAGAFAGFLLGATAGLALIVLRRANRGTAIPFGPFMLAGALLGVLLAAS